MNMQRSVWLATLWLASALTACLGGSGSSGFDITENGVIEQVLEEQRCIEQGGLTICPADTGDVVPSRPSPTPSRTIGPNPLASPTPTSTPVATGTPIPTTIPAIGVDTAGTEIRPLDCANLELDDFCGLPFAFAPRGFPATAEFRVAVRSQPPHGPWEILAEPIATGTLQVPVFEALIPIDVPAETTETGVTIQIAVLVFIEAPDLAPTLVTQLAESGADFAFVLPELTVQADF